MRAFEGSRPFSENSFPVHLGHREKVFFVREIFVFAFEGIEVFDVLVVVGGRVVDVHRRVGGGGVTVFIGKRVGSVGFLD